MNQVERKVAVTNLEQNEEEQKDLKLEQEDIPVQEESSNSPEEVPVTPDAEVADEEVISEDIPEEEVEVIETPAIEEVPEEVVVSEEEDLIAAAPSVEEESSEPEAEVTGEEIDPNSYYKEIVQKAEEFVTQKDWSFVSNELANLALHIEEGPESSSEEAKESIVKFSAIRTDFEAKKRAHYEVLNEKKAENLIAKKELLKQFSDINTEGKWSATKEVSQIKGRWESIKLLPHGEVEALNERFEKLVVEFESHKVDRLVKKLQKEEENLTLKLVILEKMDALNEKVKDEKADFEELNKEFSDLIIQWRKIGRVPAEKNQLVWDHYNKSQDAFNELRFKHDKAYRKSVEVSLEKKKKLIKEAEALIDLEDLALAARLVNKLHKVWKKTGNLPQKEENELWDKFKAATDTFNDKKTEHIDELRDQEQLNLEAKQKLIEQAEQLQNPENFEEGHQALQKLMQEWKKIGPVPRKKSSKVWNQFKATMDVFYESRREHFKDVRKDHKENLKRKNELIDKLKELAEHSDPALAVEETKKIQNEFKTVGHVPLKFKNKIWKQYREVCDTIYERYRSSGTDLGFERQLASQGVVPENRKGIIKAQKEIEGFKKDISKLESEIIQFQEASTYFKPTNKGNKLIDELNEKVEKAQKELTSKKEKIKQLRLTIRELTPKEEDNEE